MRVLIQTLFKQKGDSNSGTSKSNLSNSTQWEYVGSAYYEITIFKGPSKACCLGQYIIIGHKGKITLV